MYADEINIFQIYLSSYVYFTERIVTHFGVQRRFHGMTSQFRWNASSLVGSQHQVAAARTVVTSGCVNTFAAAAPVTVQALVYILALASISGNKSQKFVYENLDDANYVERFDKVSLNLHTWKPK